MKTQTLTVRQQFKNIVRVAQSTYAKANTNGYYRHEEKLREMLLQFSYNDFSELSKNDILILCDLYNRHRVLALHNVLSKLGKCAKNAPKINNNETSTKK